ncbi:MAG: HK97 family phage prohead protease [Clostridia bacterium]|nr:HK97 family phage prohead protease [Clostridia bacterium]
MPQTNQLIIRRSAPNVTQPVNIKPLEGIIDGYPIVFDAMTPIGNYFYEIIDRHALDEADLSDIKFLVNHLDQMLPLARHRRGKRSTMDIEIDDHGMAISAKLDIENNHTSKAVCSAVERGDIEDMSFAFGITVTGEEWSDLDKEMPLRRITKIGKVFEVSAVNDGAYPQTSISARSASLDNEKSALDNARATALENEKRAENEKRQAALLLEKQKFKFIMEEKRKCQN